MLINLLIFLGMILMMIGVVVVGLKMAMVLGLIGIWGVDSVPSSVVHFV